MSSTPTPSPDAAQSLEFQNESKRPCLYPLPDGRRCCECETCQEVGEAGVVAPAAVEDYSVSSSRHASPPLPLRREAEVLAEWLDSTGRHRGATVVRSLITFREYRVVIEYEDGRIVHKPLPPKISLAAAWTHAANCLVGTAGCVSVESRLVSAWHPETVAVPRSDHGEVKT